MTEIKYKKIDAFTAGKSQGNPAACLYLQEGQELSPQEMLDIGKQHKGFVSEVVFCKMDTDNIFLTYYSSECEVDFCGHGTIACMYELIKNDQNLLKKEKIEIETNKKGKLAVYNKINEVDAVFIEAPAPVHIGTKLSKETIAEKLKLDDVDISTECPVDLIDAGLRTLIVPVTKLEAEISVFPDEKELKEFCITNNIDIVLIFSKETADPQNIAHTRVFAPKFGYLEDPATGSGNSAFGYYMLKNKLWDGKDCSIEQGGTDRIFNTVKLSTKAGAVLFGGKATTRIDGVYYI